MSQTGQPAGAPPKTNAPQAKRVSFRDRKVTVALSLPKAIFSVFFALFVLIWVFIFGIMLGRGHNPEDAVPELSKMMPAPAAPATPPSALTGENMNDVLNPQDLRYHDTLKTSDPATKPRAQVPAQRAEKPQQPAPAKPQAPPPAPRQPVPAVSPVTPAAQANGDKTVYNYVYQVAASNNAAAAQTMQKKLQSSGLSVQITRTETGGTVWHRLLVSFKGTPDDTHGLRAKLATHGISSIILRGKTPVR